MRFSSDSSALVIVTGSTFSSSYEIQIISLNGESASGEGKFNVSLEEAR
jgi:hypothetical protein